MLNNNLLIASTIILASLIGCTHLEAISMETNTENSAQYQGKNRTDLVTTLINVDVKENKIIVKLSFKNNSKTEHVYLAKYRGASNDEMLTNFLDISSENKRIEYIGDLAKIKPSLDNFVDLRPLETLSFSREIDTSYEFLQGTHEYQIQYKAFQDYPKMPPAKLLVSNIAKFQYTK